MSDVTRDLRCERCRSRHTCRYYGETVLCWQCYSLAQLFLTLTVCGGCGGEKFAQEFFCAECLHRVT